jgi:hypothetical protein
VQGHQCVRAAVSCAPRDRCVLWRCDGVGVILHDAKPRPPSNCTLSSHGVIVLLNLSLQRYTMTPHTTCTARSIATPTASAAPRRNTAAPPLRHTTPIPGRAQHRSTHTRMALRRGRTCCPIGRPLCGRSPPHAFRLLLPRRRDTVATPSRRHNSHRSLGAHGTAAHTHRAIALRRVLHALPSAALCAAARDRAAARRTSGRLQPSYPAHTS